MNILINRLKKIVHSPVSIRLLTVGLNFISGVLINRSLGLELKGQYTTITNYANFVQLLVNSGICYIYPVLKRENETRAKDAVSTLIWIQTLLMILISAITLCFLHNLRTLQIAILSTLLICNSQIVFIALIENINKRNMILLYSTVLYIFFNVIMFIFKRGELNVIIGALAIRYLFEIIMCGMQGKIFSLDVKLINNNIRKKSFQLVFRRLYWRY